MLLVTSISLVQIWVLVFSTQELVAVVMALSVEQVPSSSRGILAASAVNNNNNNNAADRRAILTHFSSCFGVACLLSTYEDFDCTSLKPSRGTLRRTGTFAQQLGMNSNNKNSWESQVGAATNGMGSNKYERTQVRPMYKEHTASTDYEDTTIPSYNEIMEHHRQHNVQRWRQKYLQYLKKEQQHVVTNNDNEKNHEIASSKEEMEAMRHAAQIMFQCLTVILKQLKPAAQDYNWELVRSILSSSLFRTEMEPAATTLFYASPQSTAREEIGHDWGSCAWRHTCGALADVQEALAELNNAAGMLEPNECAFCLDIAERGIRSILETVPAEVQPAALPPYEPYAVNENVAQEDDYAGVVSEEKVFLRVLNELRNNDFS